MSRVVVEVEDVHEQVGDWRTGSAVEDNFCNGGDVAERSVDC